jgi:hypothetical protein
MPDTIDERCYCSILNGAIFDEPDSFALMSIVATGIQLRERGLDVFQQAVYFDGSRYMVSRLIKEQTEFSSEPTDISCSAGDVESATPELYSKFLDYVVAGKIATVPNPDGLTIITRRRSITDQILDLTNITDIVGVPEHDVPHITAKYQGKPVIILTAY